MNVQRQDDETHVASLLAIRKRITLINMQYKKNSPQSERAGLLWAGHVLAAMARRFLQEPDWPGHEVPDTTRLLWELQWYSEYCSSIGELTRSLQQAVREGKLILRSSLTRAPIGEQWLQDWLNIDIGETQKELSSALFSGPTPKALTLNTVLGEWPDAVGLPPGAADALDIFKWAEAEGLATAEELAVLLGLEPSEDSVRASEDTGIERSGVAASTIKNKLATNTLDIPIKKAIEAAGSKVMAAVYLKLRELALKEEQPFTGVIDGDALCYTTDNQRTAKLTKDALSKRLKRMG